MSSPHFTVARITLENKVMGPGEGIELFIIAITASECSELGQV